MMAKYQAIDRRTLILIFAIKLLICPKIQAQVLFKTGYPHPDTLKISYFEKENRFIKSIKKPLESSRVALLKSRVALPTTTVDSALTTIDSKGKSGEMLRTVPSILPLRVVNREQYRVSSLFGVRCHPLTGRKHHHNGVDFPQPVGTAVFATADGYVAKVGLQPNGLGLSVLIEHPGGFTTHYGHLSRYVVKMGQQIRRGQQIGRVGQTGTATGPHLHYIVRYKGRSVDPMKYCFLALDGK